MSRSQEDLGKDLVTLYNYLAPQRYTTKVRDDIFERIGRKLGIGPADWDEIMGGLIMEGVGYLASTPVKLAVKLSECAVGYLGPFTRMTWEALPTGANNFDPEDDEAMYIQCLLYGWKRNQFRYIPPKYSV